MQNRILAALFAALALLTAAPAPAQQFPQTMPSNTVYGRLGIGSGPGQAIPFATLGARILTTDFPTRAAAQAATIPANIGFITLGGYASVGDGGEGATYIRIAPPSPVMPWHFQSVSSGSDPPQWWGLNVRTIVPQMVGAVGNGVANDTDAIGSTCDYAVAFGRNISFAYGSIYLVLPAGTVVAGGERVCDLSNTTGVTVDFNNARLTTNNTFSVQGGQTYAIIALSSTNLTINNFHLTHTGTLGAGPPCSVTPSGLALCGLIGIFIGDASNNTLITNFKQVGAGAGVVASTASLTVPVNNITILGMTLDTVYYGINPTFVSGLFARGVKNHNVGRSMIAYNSHNIDVDISSDAGGPFDDIEIAVQTSHLAPSGIYNTASNIRVAYRNNGRSNATASNSLVRIGFAQGTATTTPASMKNIKLWYDVEVDSNAQPTALKLSKSDSTVRGYIIDGLEISGKFNNYNFTDKIFDMFNTADGGDWTGEVVRNVVFRDVSAFGAVGTSGVTINATAITKNLVLENVISDVNWTISNLANCVLRTTNVSIPNIAEVRAIAGITSGCITQQAQAAAGTYSWNFPTSAGTTGQPLLSGGGGVTAMTFGTLGVAGGGSGAATLTGIVQGNGTSAFTTITNSSTVGQTLRVTGAATYAWGALDLADTDAITGDLPFANLTQGSALSVLGVTGNATADVASIAAGADHNILRRSGTAVAFGSINLAQSGAVGSSILPVANGGVDQASWTSWTPTHVCGSGGPTLTSATLTGKWIKLSPKTVKLVATITITTNGTCASNITINNVPFTAVNRAAGSMFNFTSGTVGGGGAAASATTMVLTTGNGVYPGADGAVLTVSWIIEIA